MYDYIRQLNVRSLSASEISQCLLYLRYLSEMNASIDTSPTVKKLNDRLNDLRNGVGSNVISQSQ